MKGDFVPGGVLVKLSRRNLESLLHMLDNRDKERPAIHKHVDGLDYLVVEAEEDADHYGAETPGAMSWEAS